MGKLISLHAREVLDSRGNPTIEVVAQTANFSASAIVPSGASTGSHEVLELRDNDKKRFFGRGVLRAVACVNGILNKKLRGFDVSKQRKLDETLCALDGTKNKSHLGANSILGVSLACAKVAALEKGLPLFKYFASLSSSQKPPRILPIPFMNIMNGGVHADSGLEFQEMMIIPHGAPNFREALRIASEIFHTLKNLLRERNLPTTVGDEGGFAPRFSSHETAIDFLLKAIEKAHYKAGREITLAVDCAATEFYNSKNDRYHLTVRGRKKKIIAEELTAYYEWLSRKYPLISIEDGCAEDDWQGWAYLTKKLGGKIQLVGDDLFVTNPKRFKKGIEGGIANAILIKPNQIGTLTETIDVMQQAKKAGYPTIISHRSGETEDTTIAHLAVGFETGQIKTGSLCRSERIAKYNELLRIEEMLGTRARFGKMGAFLFQ